MENLTHCIKHSKGKFNFLDKAYNNFIRSSIEDEQSEEQWEIYNQIMIELVNLNKLNYFEEVKYRIIDGENINDVMFEIINKDFETKSMLNIYEERIRYFQNYELMLQFCYK